MSKSDSLSARTSTKLWTTVIQIELHYERARYPNHVVAHAMNHRYYAQLTATTSQVPAYSDTHTYREQPVGSFAACLSLQYNCHHRVNLSTNASPGLQITSDSGDGPQAQETETMMMAHVKSERVWSLLNGLLSLRDANESFRSDKVDDRSRIPG
ncbi:Hypothetical protein D9617_1g086280 [Elsinoe fawcettii]|nr:Hypothetical protein D9617_1g086280 [Elsinoe fawcettii]